MSLGKFQLEKEEKKVRFQLEKENLTSITAMVSIVLDISGSMSNLYDDGVVQEALQRVLPVALNLDDNGELDVYTFTSGTSGAHKVNPSCTRKNYDNFVNEQILSNSRIPKWGGTDYSPVLTQLAKDYGFIQEKKTGGFFGLFGNKEHKTVYASESTSKYPAVCYFFTDGDNSDRDDTRLLFKKLAEEKSNLYFLLIGIGTDSEFKYLEWMADTFPNVGHLKIGDLGRQASSEDFHKALLPTELCEWLRERK